METLRDLQLVRAMPSETPEFRAAEDGAPSRLVIRFSPFDIWYEINSMFEGRFLERTTPGTFKRTINNSGLKRVKVTFNHGFDPTMGDQILGPLVDLREDRDAAVGEVDLLDGIPPLLLSGLRAGVYGSSMSFSVVRDEWNDDPPSSAYNPDRLPERTIKEARLYEFGPVSFPANPEATAGFRCVTDPFYERMRERDSHVADLLARARALRTPTDDPARSTSSDGPAEEPEVGPVENHPTGLSPMARRQRLIALLTGETR